MAKRLRSVVLMLAILCIVASRGMNAQENERGPETAPLNPLSEFDPSSLDAFRDRPLFSPSRQAIADLEPAREPVAAIGLESLNIQLLGVVKTPQGSIARIADLDNSAKYSLRAGETFRDWAVVRIDASNLTLRKGEQTRAFTIFTKADPNSGVDIGSETAVRPETSETSRPVRIIEDAKRASQEPVTKMPAVPAREAQDLIDFFGPNAQPAN